MMNRLMLLCAAGLLLASPAHSQTRILGTAEVAAAIARGALIWDVRTVADHAKGHIPGAVNAGTAYSLVADTVWVDYLPPAVAAKRLGDAGFDPARETIVYSVKGSSGAYYGARALRYYGFATTGVYHGGIDDWKGAGKQVDTGAVAVTAREITLRKTPDLVIWNDGLLSRLRAGKVQMIDVRGPDEFSGKEILAERGGHIPGAVHMPFVDNWIDPDIGRKLRDSITTSRDGMALKSSEELKKIYAGLDPAAETIVYCQVGARASQSATVLESIGFTNVRLYEPSWLGYAPIGGAAVDSLTVAPDTLAAVGYACAPCGCPGDEAIHEKPGDCPECGMAMIKLTSETIGLKGIRAIFRVNDSVWTSGQPLVRHYAGLKAAGVNTVINLRMPSEHDADREKSELSGLGINYYNIPVDYSKPTAEDADKFLALTDEKLPGGRVLLHCTAAIRVGAFWAIRRVMRDGWSLDEALAEARIVGLTDQSDWVDYVKSYVASAGEKK